MTTRFSTWRRVANDPADWFSVEELERSRSYQRPLARLRLVRGALTFVALAAFVGFEAGPNLVDALGLDNWVLQLLAVIVALEVIGLVYNPALDWWVDLVHDKRWGLSNQTPRGFVSDQVKSLALGIVMYLVLLVPLYALIRGTDLWWFWGWLLLLGFSVGIGFVYPIVIAPIFNTFTPLDHDDLNARIRDIAARAEVAIEGAFVADESRRSQRPRTSRGSAPPSGRALRHDPRAPPRSSPSGGPGRPPAYHLRRQIPRRRPRLVMMLALRARRWGGLWS